MVDTSSAESVTKFLRSKDGSISDIIKVANKLLDNKLNVYLPNKTLFILNLLIDRLNDKSNSAFAKWKYDVEVWKLLKKVYHNQEEIQKLKIIDITIIILQDESECVSEVLNILNLCLENSYVELDEFAAMKLLSTYITHINSKTMLYSRLIKKIYDNTTSKLSLDGSKKMNIKFFEECCFPLLKFLSTHQESCFKSVLLKEIFASNSLQYFATNLEKALEKQKPDEVSLIYLYQLAVDKLSSTHMVICEQVFNIISEKYRHLSEKLLSILASSQKTISSEFVESIYKNEIKDKQFKDLNWSMVKDIFEIDNEVATKKSSFLFKKYNSGFGLDHLILPVAEVIVDAYLKSRELEEFLTDVWPRALKNDEFWESPPFVGIVSKTIKTLSTKQLVNVIEQSYKLKEEVQQKALLTAITRGLTDASYQTINSIKEILLQNQEFFNSAKEEFWQIRYNLLCLYGSEYLIPEEVLKTDYDLYFYFTLFRLVELKLIDNIPEIKQIQFLKFLKDEYNPSLVHQVFNRWFIVFNDFFNEANNHELIELGFKAQIFVNPNPYIFEQTRLTSNLIQSISSDLSRKLSFISKIPIVCFNKLVKKDLINSLTTLAIEKNEESLIQIKYLLQQPSYQSKLETSFDTLIQLFESSTESTKGLIFEICVLVWSNHVNQIKNKENQVYVDAAIQKILTFYDDDEVKQIDPEVELTLTILSSTKMKSELLDRLRQKFIETCIENLKNSTDLYSINWYLWAFIMVKPTNDEEIMHVLNNIDSDMTSGPFFQKTVFKYICSVPKVDFKKSCYVLSLFLALGFEDVYDDLVMFLRKVSIDQHTYIKTFHFFTNSVDNVPVEMNKCFTQIACAFVSTSKKEFDLSLQTCFNVFKNSYKDSKSALLILTTIRTLLVEKAWIFNQYLLESTLGMISFFINNLHTFDNHDEIYITSTQVISHILLYHRHKLTTRHNLLLNLMSSFFIPLTTNQELQITLASAESFVRLLSNLCEPQERSKEINLSTQSNLFKKALRKHLPVLLTNYIHLNLRYNFDKSINKVLMEGVYIMFDVLSQPELRSVSAALDYAGRSFYKTLYDDYKDHGKWKDN